jgi:hypothetical protein
MSLDLTVEAIAEILAYEMRRVEAIKAIGGIPLYEVVGEGRAVPEGWVLDQATCFFVPAGFQFHGTMQ